MKSIPYFAVAEFLQFEIKQVQNNITGWAKKRSSYYFATNCAKRVNNLFCHTTI